MKLPKRGRSAPPGFGHRKDTAMMDGGMWMMGGIALVWILTLVVLVLAIAALVKYLRG